MKTISINPKRILTIQMAIIAALSSASFVVTAYYLQERESLLDVPTFFFVGAELNIPSWYSYSAILMTSLLAFTIWLALRDSPEASNYWLLLAAVLMYICLDEAISIHEKTIVPVRDYFNLDRTPLSSAWVIPFFIIFILLGLIFLRFLFELPKKVKIIFICSGMLLLVGSIGFEILEMISLINWGLGHKTMILITIEEFLEMSAFALLTYGLLTHLKDIGPITLGK